MTRLDVFQGRVVRVGDEQLHAGALGVAVDQELHVVGELWGECRTALGGIDDSGVLPTCLAVFADPAGERPHATVERLYHHVELSPLPQGGHFAETEEPLLLADDIIRFFASDATRWRFALRVAMQGRLRKDIGQGNL